MKRYLRWTFHCRRGKRCAHAVLTHVDDTAPAGAVVVIRYMCGGCGTWYVTESLLGGDGSWAAGDRRRVAA